jgi:tRNA (guanosine-2'-O-)-methyltransferase
VLRDRTGDLALLLEEPYDPGNLSATLRTAEALGIQNVHVVRAKRWHVRRRVTQRSDRWITVRRFGRVGEALEALRAEGYRIVVAGLGRGSVELSRVDPLGKLAVAFGNESVGASRELLAGADGEFWIPTLGFSGSLNLSVAVGITLWDLRGRQIAGRGKPGDLPDEVLAELRESWYARLARGKTNREWDFRDWLGRVEPTDREGPPPDRRKTGSGSPRASGEKA